MTRKSDQPGKRSLLIAGVWTRRPWVSLALVASFSSPFLTLSEFNLHDPLQRRTVRPAIYEGGELPARVPTTLGPNQRTAWIPSLTGHFEQVAHVAPSMEQLGLLFFPAEKIRPDQNLIGIELLSNVRVLVLHDFDDPSIDLSPIAGLPKLQELAFSEDSSVTRQQWQQLAEAPALEHLRLPRLATGGFEPSDLSPLAATGTLRTVSLAVEPRGFGREARAVHASLPDARAVPSVQPRIRSLMVPALFWSWPLLLGGLGALVNAWMGRGFLHLLPAGGKRHRSSLRLLAAVAWLWLAAVLFAGGWAWLPALALTAAGLGTMAWVAVRSALLHPAEGRRMWWWKNASGFGIAALIPLGGWLASRHLDPAWLAAFAAGTKPLATLLLLAWASVATVLADRALLAPWSPKPNGSSIPQALLAARKTLTPAQPADPDGWPLRSRPALPVLACAFSGALVALSLGEWVFMTGPQSHSFEALLLLTLALLGLLSVSFGHWSRRWTERLKALPTLIPLPGRRAVRVDRFLRDALGDAAALWPTVVAAAAVGFSTSRTAGLLYAATFVAIALAGATSAVAFTLHRPGPVLAKNLLFGWWVSMTFALPGTAGDAIEAGFAFKASLLVIASSAALALWARHRLIRSEHPPA